MSDHADFHGERLGRGEPSLTAIDYGLMVALLLVALVTVMTSVWTWVYAGV